MGRSERMSLIREIEKRRGSKILVYIAGDRKGLESKIAGDIFPVFHKHLAKIGDQEKIDLFLYSTGGLTVAGYGLVNLIREFTEKFNVIVPFKALSCATLITLGADEIVMTKTGQLSPIDPSTLHALAPRVKAFGRPEEEVIPVSVEEVNAFIELARQEIGLKKEASFKTTLELLSGSVHPLVLGAVHRSREQTRFFASELLKCHLKDKKRIRTIVNLLTREMYSHDQLISRREAKEVLRLNIVEPDTNLTKLILDLLDEYYGILHLDKPYHPELVLGGDNEKTVDLYLSIIESIDFTYTYMQRREVKRVTVQQPGIPQPVVNFLERPVQEGWIENNGV
jgi:hypothetical protein